MIQPANPKRLVFLGKIRYTEYIVGRAICGAAGLQGVFAYEIDDMYGSLYMSYAILRKEKAMVKHIILWTLKEELTESEKERVKADIKAGLEGLAGKIPGLLEIRVHTQGLPSSNADLMLDSSFVDEAALKGYAVHPEHVAVADGKVRPYTAVRTCLDYEA